ncbi:hypothetical protein Syun_017236 [Stephania yunnanensis]|uniref:PUM-HD domain-containing protein n=1 Tax=Stephania yunnanensis TaxID=152371 RepID=A0AAP0P362_9MAGN
MERRIEQEIDELEMLLGEIPNMTSENQRAETSISPNAEGLSFGEGNGHSSPSTNHSELYRSSQTKSPGKSAAYGGLSFDMPSTSSQNSFQGSPEQRVQINGKLMGSTVSNDGRLSADNVNRDSRNILTGGSFSSAFTKLSVSDRLTGEDMSPSYLLEGWRQNHLQKPFPRSNSGNLVIQSPPSSHTINRMMSPISNGINKINLEMKPGECGMYAKIDVQQVNDLNPSLDQLLGTCSREFREQQHTLPVYSGAMPFGPDLSTLGTFSNVSVPTNKVEFSVAPYQQQYFLNAGSPIPLLQTHQLRQSPISWSQMKDYRRINQNYLYSQQHPNQTFGASYPIQEKFNVEDKSMIWTGRKMHLDMSTSPHLELGREDSFWDNAAILKGFDAAELAAARSRFCHYCAQGLCSGGESCLLVSSQKQLTRRNSAQFSPFSSFKNLQSVQAFDNIGKPTFHEKILTRNHCFNSVRAVKPGYVGLHDNLNGKFFSDNQLDQYQCSLNAASFSLNGQSSFDSSTDFKDVRHNDSRCPPTKYNTVEDVEGRIYVMAKDQHGCRFLQRKFSEGNVEDIFRIFAEIIDHIVELMTDNFGNYLVQKLLEVCSDDQRMQVLQEVTRKPGELVRISCDSFGTRAVQRLIEFIKTPKEFSLVVSSLKPGLLKLAKDANGNHVVQRCLQCLLSEYREFLFEAATVHCIELARDRHGCCVLQKYLSHSDDDQRHQVISKLASDAFDLSQHPFGNYVIQFVLELGIPWATVNVLNKMDGNYGHLSMQKYSSNVVEKCMKHAGDEQLPHIIQELLSTHLDEISQDPFGNYVIQAALNHSKGALRSALVEAIKPYVPALRNNPYGKKVLPCINLKN